MCSHVDHDPFVSTIVEYDTIYISLVQLLSPKWRESMVNTHTGFHLSVEIIDYIRAYHIICMYEKIKGLLGTDSYVKQIQTHRCCLDTHTVSLYYFRLILLMTVRPYVIIKNIYVTEMYGRVDNL